MIQSYPWYIADWRESETRMRLSLAERALYRELLDYCYLEGSLPTDPLHLSRIAGCSVAEIKRILPIVGSLFYRDGERMRHAKVDEVRKKLEAYHNQKKHAGAASGRTRRERSLNGRSTPVPEVADGGDAPEGTEVGTEVGTKDQDPLKSAIESGESEIDDAEDTTDLESEKLLNGRSTCAGTQDEPSPAPSPAPSLIKDKTFSAADAAAPLELVPPEWKPSEAWWRDHHDEFYGGYWCKRDKADSMKAYRKCVLWLVAKGMTHEEAAVFLIRKRDDDRQRFERTEDWNWRCRLHPATWLNGHRWEDEVSAPQAFRPQRLTPTQLALQEAREMEARERDARAR